MREACPRCLEAKRVITTNTGLLGPGLAPYVHECLSCGQQWGHVCWHCHDDPPQGHTCPQCGRNTP
jgi:hypothetical protein